MKKLLLGTALAALLASPALARDYQGADTALPSARTLHELRGINAQALSPAESVYFNGRVVGADPDTNVRLSFERDPEPSNR
jgi:opacity protein-like surface antigen